MFARPISLAALALLSCIAAPVSSAGAQLADLMPGVRARIRAPGTIVGRLTGTVIARSADSLSIATEHGVQAHLPLSRLTDVEISRGKSRSRGALKGVLWGGGFGLFSGLFSDGGENVSRGETAAAGVLGGALFGAGIGAAVQSERWVRLTVPVRVALVQTHGGPTAALSMRF